MVVTRKTLWSFTTETFDNFLGNQPFQMAGALSYYTLLSMAPLLLLVISTAGLVFGQEAVAGQLVIQMQSLMGNEGAEVIQTVIANANNLDRGIISLIIGIVLVVIGASTVFVQLQTSLNQIWNVEASPDMNVIWSFLYHRLLSVSMIFVIAFLLLVSLVISTVLSGMHDCLNQLLPGAVILWQFVNIAVSLGLITLLIGLIFKFLPDAHISWRYVWLGAGITSVLFTLGKYLIGLYLGQASVGSVYGAAGSVVVLMVWIYYASLILFFGAEITQVVARRLGSAIEPSEYAVTADDLPV